MQNEQTTQTNSFTEDEQALATKYKVEPKTVRLISEIVSERTEGINQLVRLMQGKNEQDVKPESEMPKTGEILLDDWLEELNYPEACIAYACMEMSWSNNALGDKLSAALRFKTNEMLKKAEANKLDIECHLLPGLKWLSFCRGLRLQEDSQYAKADTEKPQTEETETERKMPEPEMLDDPHPMTVIKDWLSKLTYREKMAAVLMTELLQKDYEYYKFGCCERQYGNTICRQFEHSIIEASQDKEYLKNADPEEVVMTGLTTSLLFWYA